MNNINWKEGSVRVCLILALLIELVTGGMYFILSFASNLPEGHTIARAGFASLMCLTLVAPLDKNSLPLIQKSPWFTVALLLTGNIFYLWSIYYLPTVGGNSAWVLAESLVLFLTPHFIVYFIRAVFRYIIGGFLKPTR